ncbi:uncharacterized protein [Antedon mediterranea]|uniref:uncharacterized protein isoform X2 n=1 Tax=Antedon mediterranea TaxID=105859 RepID=UPI003AF59198
MVEDSKTFENLKTDLSRLYEGERYLWLRYCVFDFLSVGKITDPDSNGYDLLCSLQENSKLTTENVDILLEINQLTEIKEAQDLVTRYMEDNEIQKGSDKRRLTPYRERLFKAIREVCPDEFKEIIFLYGLNQYDFKNLWNVVLKLEIDGVLADEPEKIKRFANCLGKMARNKLLDDDFSDEDFRCLIADFAQWYDQRGLLNQLKLLFIDKLDRQVLEKFSSTIELLNSLHSRGLFSQRNPSVLYDAIQLTEQFDLEPTLKEKLPDFNDIGERKIVSFSPHTINIVHFGQKLGDSEINILDRRYNFPVVKKYTDRWSLILDFENRGLLKEEKIEKINKVLKR